MNPHTPPPVSPKAIVCNFWRHRELVLQMTKRDVIGRYKGSLLGLGWSFFNPIIMLVVYTFVFSVVFKARWGTDGDEGKTEFAVILFVGLIVHALFCEMLTRSPGIILSNVNYVKKVVFPLEILPLIAMGTALFHSLVSLSVLLIAFAVLHGFIYWTALLIPLVLLPLCFVALGFAWFLASLGVFLRDVGQFMGIVAVILMFLSPVFYPLSILPEKYHVFILANPLTFNIEQARQVLIFGQYPDWLGLAIYGAVSLVIAWLGYWWFQKTRKGFADVI